MRALSNLDDSIIKVIMHDKRPELAEAKALLQRIEKRKLVRIDTHARCRPIYGGLISAVLIYLILDLPSQWILIHSVCVCLSVYI